MLPRQEQLTPEIFGGKEVCMDDMIHVYGVNLLMTKISLVGSERFFKQTQIDKRRVPDAMMGLKVVKDVLWMRMLETSEGMKLPNGCRWFYYISFWGSKPKFYRFRYPATTKWSIHSLKEA
jgi:hypothetical protein